MIDVSDLQVISQLVDTLSVLSQRLESSYNSSNSSEFSRIKTEILDIQSKIREMTS